MGGRLERCHTRWKELNGWKFPSEAMVGIHLFGGLSRHAFAKMDKLILGMSTLVSLVVLMFEGEVVHKFYDQVILSFNSFLCHLDFHYRLRCKHIA